jgi:hypothetical protein
VLQLMTMTVQELRSNRLAAQIPSAVLATRSGINLSRLSCIEHRYVQPTEDEMRRLSDPLSQLLHAKSLVQHAAVGVGCPMATCQ